jgi:hypothetical protein
MTTTQSITRRIFLSAAVAAAMTAALPAADAGAATASPATAGPGPRALSPAPREAKGQQGNASITTSVGPEPDVTSILYTIANVGSAADTFTVWYSDQNTGRQSRKLVYALEPGEYKSGEVYGRVNHSFLMNVCQSDGTCFTVGPIGPAVQSGERTARGLPAREQRSIDAPPAARARRARR